MRRGSVWQERCWRNYNTGETCIGSSLKESTQFPVFKITHYHSLNLPIRVTKITLTSSMQINLAIILLKLLKYLPHKYRSIKSGLIVAPDRGQGGTGGLKEKRIYAPPAASPHGEKPWERCLLRRDKEQDERQRTWIMKGRRSRPE